MRPRWMVALAAFAMAGCDDLGPGGPNETLGTVTGDVALGAAVIDFTWGGVTDIEGRGTTQVYSARVSGSPERHRIILVDPTGGDLTFTLALEDLALSGPDLTVVSAVGTDNLPLDASELRVVLER